MQPVSSIRLLVALLWLSMLSAAIIIATPDVPSAKPTGVNNNLRMRADGPLTGDFATAVANGWVNLADYECTDTSTCTPPAGIPWCTLSGDPSYPTPGALNAAVAASSDTPTCINDPRTSMTFINPTIVLLSTPAGARASDRGR